VIKIIISTLLGTISILQLRNSDATGQNAISKPLGYIAEQPLGRTALDAPGKP